MSEHEERRNVESCPKNREEILRLLTALGKAIYSIRKVIVVDSLGHVERLDQIHRLLWEKATIRITHDQFPEYQDLSELRLMDECPLDTAT